MGLDAQAEALLAKRASLGAPAIETMTVDAARSIYGVLARDANVHSVDDHSVSKSDGGTVPVRVYRPTADSDLPIIVFCHGGGWTLAGVAVYDPLCRELADRTGCVVVAVDYRLAPENPYPAGLEDVYAATVWAWEHAAEIGGSPRRLAVAGDSAGGNLAAATALRARDEGGPPLDFQVLIYPAVDRGTDLPSSREFASGYLLENAAVDWFWGHYFGAGPIPDDPYLLPARSRDLAGLPAAVVITAECDPLRDDAEAYADRLADAGVAVLKRRYSGTFHGFFHMTGVLDQAALAMDDLAAVVRRHVSASGVVDG